MDQLATRYPPSLFSARSGGLLDKAELRVEHEQALEARRCHVMIVSEQTSESGFDGIMETTLAFDHATNLPVLEETSTKVSVLLLPALQVKTRFVYERVEANPALSAETFHFEAPADSQFVELEQLLPSEDSELVGKPVPPAQFHTLDGRTVDLAEYRGQKAVLLVFWATWCAPCKAELNDLELLHSEGEVVNALQIIVVSTDDSPRTVRSFLERHVLPFIVLHDRNDQASSLFGVNVIPTTLLIDRQGSVIKAWTGWAHAGVRLDAIREVAEGASLGE